MHLSSKAEQDLKSIDESILGLLWFQGLATSDTENNHPEEIAEGYVWHGDQEVPLNGAQSAMIDDESIDKSKLTFIKEHSLKLFRI